MSSDAGDNRPYEVGYAKPPVETRFKPGQCGNPAGRPPGSKGKKSIEREESNLRQIVLEEKERLIRIQDANGKSKYITQSRAVVRSIFISATKGHVRAQKLYAELIRESEDTEHQRRLDIFERFHTYKQQWSGEFRKHPGLKQLPHPDDVILDFDKGEVRIAGPVSEEERPRWKKWRHIREMVATELGEIEKTFAKYGGSDAEVDRALSIIAEGTRFVLARIDDALGGARALMRFLEQLDVGELDNYVVKRRRIGLRKNPVTGIIWKAMKSEYERETGKGRRR